jgi:3-deoxy-D-manno-octulosonic-acid transferase
MEQVEGWSGEIFPPRLEQGLLLLFRICYNIILTFVIMLGLLPFLVASLFYPHFRYALGERFGFIRTSKKKEGALSLWIHASSVGESLILVEVSKKIADIGEEILLSVSTTTYTGRKIIEERMAERLLNLFFFPLDHPWIVKRTLDKTKPDAVVIIETEIWPNLIVEADRRRIPVFIINGRISDRSIKRYALLKPFLASILPLLTHAMVQTEKDWARFTELGLDREKITVAGNIKFDLLPETSERRPPFLDGIDEKGPLLIAGSTIEGEEEILIPLFAELRKEFEKLTMILAPRHPERFESVAAMIRESGLPSGKRSAGDKASPSSLFLLDSLGELSALYRWATIVFIGGSLVPHGGHNIIEPALYGKPVLFGPSMENFEAVKNLFLERNGAIGVSDKKELEERLKELLKDPDRREETGRRGREIVEENQGASDRTVEMLNRFLCRKEQAARQ